jgi:hypothetical protein
MTSLQKKEFLTKTLTIGSLCDCITLVMKVGVEFGCAKQMWCFWCDDVRPIVVVRPEVKWSVFGCQLCLELVQTGWQDSSLQSAPVVRNGLQKWGNCQLSGISRPGVVEQFEIFQFVRVLVGLLQKPCGTISTFT